jgi:hypothetical protein
MDLTTQPADGRSKPPFLSMEARRILSAASSSALSLLVAIRDALPGSSVWEPESLWITLEKMGVDVPLVNRAKIQAAIALIYVPSFYWDALVFEKTALAFSDELPHPAILQEAQPSQLAWAVVEAQRIVEKLNLDHTEFETEPKVYAAVVLHRAGIALAPPELAFAQEQLDKLNVGGAELRTRVAEQLAQHGLPDAANHAFEETPLGVQLGYLSIIRLCVEERRKQLDAELSRLG